MGERSVQDFNDALVDAHVIGGPGLGIEVKELPVEEIVMEGGVAENSPIQVEEEFEEIEMSGGVEENAPIQVNEEFEEITMEGGVEENAPIQVAEQEVEEIVLETPTARHADERKARAVEEGAKQGLDANASVAMPETATHSSLDEAKEAAVEAEKSQEMEVSQEQSHER